MHNTTSIESPWRGFIQDTKNGERSLITKLHICKKENISILDYLKHFKGIYDELIDIQNQSLMMIKSVG